MQIKNLKKVGVRPQLYILIFLCLPVHAEDSFGFDPQKTLKDYAGTTIIGSKITYDGEDGIFDVYHRRRNAELHLSHCTGMQPLAYPNWNGTWPQSKPYKISHINFHTKRLNALVNWGMKNDQKILHHLMIAPNKYFPNWFWRTDYTAEEYDKLLLKYITTVMNANDNKNKLAGWNVINELFRFDGSGRYQKPGKGKHDCRWMKLGYEEDRSGLQGMARINTKHPIVYRKVLKYASIASGKLEIRETDVIEINRKSDALYQLIKHLKNTKVRVDAVGFQCHLNVTRSYDWNSAKSNITRFHELGVEVYITELDVGMPWNWKEGEPFPENYEERQARMYYDCVKAAREAKVERIDTWGLSDISDQHWRTGQKAFLFDKQFKRKKTYQAYLKALYDTK